MKRARWRSLALGLLASRFILVAPWLHAEPASGAVLHLVDDLGKPLSKPVEVCFQIDLRTDCQRVAPGTDARLPSTFYSLRIEGEDHGPLAIRREALTPEPDGSCKARVARKAWLHVETGARQQPLAVSLYLLNDSTFREPAFRTRLAPGEAEVKVPAGEFLASLALERNAPDLQRLKARPAAHARLTYHPRRGWSLVARCRAAATGRPVHRAEVKAAEVFGYGRKERPLAESVSAEDGLVLLPGLDATMASLSVRHPEFIPAEVQGLTASPGTFAFKSVDLPLGGRLVAHVTLHGRPVAGAGCRLYALVPGEHEVKKRYRELWAGRGDALGVCRSASLAQGVYQLRVRVPDNPSEVDRWVTLHEAQEVDEDVSLTPTRVSGEVRRGEKATEGYTVRALKITSDLPKGAYADAPAEAASDEAGKYELTLWAPGRYHLYLVSPSGANAVSGKLLSTEGDEEKRLDFDLDAGSVRGRVVDEAGKPVGAAWVGLRFWSGSLRVTADAEGRFEIDAEGEGTGTLTAGKAGYQDADLVEVQLAKEASIPPVTLVLKRKTTTEGRVVTAAGAPVAGAWVASVVSTPEMGPLRYRSTQSREDGSFEVETPPGPLRVFVSGPGCPLSGFVLPTPPDAGATAPGETGAPSAKPILRCPELPTTIDLTLVDDKGNPVAHTGVVLVREGGIVPQQVLADHLRLLGLPAETDGVGHLVLAGLSPGNYEVFLNTLSSEGTIAAGLRLGFLTSVGTSGLETAEIQATLPAQ